MEAKRILLLVHQGAKSSDEEGVLSGQQGMPKEEEGTMKFIGLPHPRLGEPMKYLLNAKGTIMELQKATTPKDSYASYFVGDSVVSSGCTYIASRIDPLFLVLPALSKRSSWAPIEQTLAEDNLLLLQEHPLMNLECICDKNDKALEDTVLYRLNAEKVLLWLRAKIDRILKLFLLREKKNVEEDEGNGEEGTGSIADCLNGGKRAMTDEERLQTALELVCDYLPKAWGERLSESYSQSWQPLFETRPTKKRKVAEGWGSTETDRNLELSMGSASSQGRKAAQQSAKAESKLSSKLSKAKATAKGTKSISSFFGAAPKKKG